MKLLSFQQTCEQLTIMQIHDDANQGNGPNKPLLRIYQKTNNLFAAIKTDAGGAATTHIDLGPTPSGYFDCDITVNSGNMTISINGAEKVNQDISYWTFPSYWKNGVYLQDPGEAITHFNELTLTTGAPTVATTGVNITPQATIEVGGTQQLSPTVTPSNATNTDVSYSSSNSAIASVNSSGLVTANQAGSATITVTTASGGFTDTTQVTVIAPSTGANLALNKPVTATGNADGSNLPANIVDGSLVLIKQKWFVIMTEHTSILLKLLKLRAVLIVK